MKVVKQKSTGKIVYRESPDFKEGKGINNASTFKKIDKNDLEELDISQVEWDEYLTKRSNEGERDGKIRAEMWRIAEQSLIDSGDIERR